MVSTHKMYVSTNIYLMSHNIYITTNIYLMSHNIYISTNIYLVSAHPPSSSTSTGVTSTRAPCSATT